MAKTKQELNDKKELARLYYMQGDSQKNIAERINVSSVTVCKWVKECGWEEFRAAKTITRKELIIKMLQEANKKLEEGNMSADEMAKVASAIEKIDKQTNVVTVIEVFTAYGNWLIARMSFDSELTPEMVKAIHKYQDLFIGEKLSGTRVEIIS